MKNWRSLFSWQTLLDLLQDGASFLFFSRNRTIKRAMMTVVIAIPLVYGCATHDSASGWAIYTGEMNYLLEPKVQSLQRTLEFGTKYVLMPLAESFSKSIQKSIERAVEKQRENQSSRL